MARVLGFLPLACRLAMVLAAGLCALSQAYAFDVLLLRSDRNPAYQEAATAIADELYKLNVARTEVGTTTVADWQKSRASMPTNKVWVALGSEALQVALNTPGRPLVVASMLPRSAYERVLREAGGRNPGVSAVYLDQPMARIMLAARAAYPDSKRVGVLWGAESAQTQNAFQQAAAEQGFVVRSAQVQSPAQLFASLQAVLDDAQLLVALADPAVYNPSTVGNILLTSYRSNVPVLAFSPAYVRAGALLGIYTAPKQLGGQTATMVLHGLSAGSLPTPQYPVAFTIDVNEYVAKSLGVALSPMVITDKVRRLEGARP